MEEWCKGVVAHWWRCGADFFRDVNNVMVDCFGDVIADRQCFGSGVKGLLDPNPDSESGFRGLKKGLKIK